jgi:hypothetical protein
MPKKTKNDKDKIEITIQSTTEFPTYRIYSNHVEIMQSPHDFSLKFCDATPINNIEEVKKNKGIHKIPVVAEIAIPFQLVESLINALQTQYDKYKEITGDNNGKKTRKK